MEDDSNKINQLNNLFQEGKVDKINILRYILKLCLKFLANNKFKETCLITDKIFSKQLDNKFIIDNKFLTEKRILDDISFLKYLEKLDTNNFYQTYKFDYTLLCIQYTVILIKSVLNNYFKYKDFKKTIILKNMINLKRKQSVYIIYLGYIIKL